VSNVASVFGLSLSCNFNNDKVTTFSCSSRTFKALFLLLNDIVVVDADIKGVGDGVVDVKMTFIHP
jgi:hypothetical protein